jgi:hypothetical protein
MAAGKPIIATSIGSQREVASRAEMAELVRPASAPALSEAIVRLAENPALMARLGANARTVYESYYTENRMLRSYRQLYFDLLRARFPAEATSAARGYDWRLAGSEEQLRESDSGLVPASRQPKGGGL